MQLADHWYRKIISEGYAKRRLSKPGDRLVAVAGLARIWAQRMQDVYIAGNWEGSFAYSLAWTRDGRPCPGGGPPHGPSWSWASHPGRVEWNDECSLFEPDAYLRLKGSNLEYGGPIEDRFSPVGGGSVLIAGRTAEINIGTNQSWHDAWIGGLKGYFFSRVNNRLIAERYELLR
ncbi:hypothetical protein B0T16DRAFT_422151 [Cercophora newfieldiana]|uniref:Uncharacterized protein n=1 Tax=Cercophora newfieldiana TaxID=92897 RepID=A0AA39XRL5_9PEZI|nr:hypothetical protein B0T16DRAFT_422151 [Cercophora newfieldiana]